jgi:hypothetical protein
MGGARDASNVLRPVQYDKGHIGARDMHGKTNRMVLGDAWEKVIFSSGIAFFAWHAQFAQCARCHAGYRSCIAKPSERKVVPGMRYKPQAANTMSGFL